MKGYTPRWEVKRASIGDMRYSDSYSEEYRAYFYSKLKNRAYYALIKFKETPGATTGKFWLVAKIPNPTKRKWETNIVMSRMFSDVESKSRVLRNVEDSIRECTTRCKEAYGGLVEHSAVFSEHWERNDGERILLIVNACENEAVVNYTSGLEDGKYTLSGDACGTLEIKNGCGKTTVPPFSIVYAKAE